MDDLLAVGRMILAANLGAKSFLVKIDCFLGIADRQVRCERVETVGNGLCLLSPESSLEVWRYFRNYGKNFTPAKRTASRLLAIRGRGLEPRQLRPLFPKAAEVRP